MKKLTFILAILAITCASSAQKNCKPDVSNEDKITKQKIDVWEENLYETGFGTSMIATSEVNISVSIGRYGAVNAVNIILTKEEESTANAILESAMKAAKGNQFFLGIKESAPLIGIADEVRNETKTNPFNGKIVTTVVLSGYIKDEELPKIKELVIHKPIDAVRIILENNLIIEKSVKEKKGEKMMNKFKCYFNFLADNGVLK